MRSKQCYLKYMVLLDTKMLDILEEWLTLEQGKNVKMAEALKKEQFMMNQIHVLLSSNCKWLYENIGKTQRIHSLIERVALNCFISKANNICLPFFNILKGKKMFQMTAKCEEAFQVLKKHLEQSPLLSKPKANNPYCFNWLYLKKPLGQFLYGRKILTNCLFIKLVKFFC